jgi:hypothetical protein
MWGCELSPEVDARYISTLWAPIKAPIRREAEIKGMQDPRLGKTLEKDLYKNQFQLAKVFHIMVSQEAK